MQPIECPVCKNIPTVTKHVTSGESLYSVGCPACKEHGLVIEGSLARSESDAVQSWNASVTGNQYLLDLGSTIFDTEEFLNDLSAMIRGRVIFVKKTSNITQLNKQYTFIKGYEFLLKEVVKSIRSDSQRYIVTNFAKGQLDLLKNAVETRKEELKKGN